MRHVTAGFLVEFLGLDWREGERWYHDTLVDADVAINAYMSAAISLTGAQESRAGC